MFTEKISQLKTWAVNNVLWAEKNLKGKSGVEKKAAVIKKLDDMIQLPTYLEWADDIVISWVVDKVCDKLNALTNHDFSGLTLTEQQEQEIANTIENPKERDAE